MGMAASGLTGMEIWLFDSRGYCAWDTLTLTSADVQKPWKNGDTEDSFAASPGKIIP